MRWDQAMDVDPLQLRTKAGGVVTLFRKVEVDSWLEDLRSKPPRLTATWRGFEVNGYKRQSAMTWEKC